MSKLKITLITLIAILGIATAGVCSYVFIPAVNDFINGIFTTSADGNETDTSSDTKVAEYEAQIAELQARVDELNAQITQLEAEGTADDETIAQLRQDVEDYEAQIEALQALVDNEKLVSIIDGSVTTLTATDLEGITSISDYAFYNNTSLTSIEIPSTVTSIGDYAFYGCTNLESVTFEDTNSGLSTLSAEEETEAETTLTIGMNAFRNCTSLTSISLPANLASLSSSAFAGCTSLETADISSCSNLDSIKQYTFQNCTSLTDITIPEGITSIGTGAFYNTTALTEINFNAINCADFASSNNIFYNSGTKSTGISLNIGSDVENIPAYFMYPNSTAVPNLTSINYTETSAVTTIGTYAFYNATGITEITIPENVTTIGTYAFYNATSVTEINFNAISCADFSSSNYIFPVSTTLYKTINIGLNVEQIPAYFMCPNYGTSSSHSIMLIKEVNIDPDCALTTFGNRAFSYCYGFASITIPKNVTSVTSSFDSSYPLAEVYNCSSLTFSSYFAGTYPLNIYTPTSGSSKLETIGDYIFYRDDSATSYLVQYTGTSTDLTLPETTEFSYEIYKYCFYYNTSITSVSLSSSVIGIGTYAFYQCTSLTSIDLSACSALTGIGSNAFYSCTSLSSIDLSACSALTSIGSYAFSDCASLTSIDLSACSALTSIGESAFKSCKSFTSIWIPASVTTISASSYSYSPFYNCPSSLVIYCEADEAQSGWSTYWNYYTSNKALTTYYGYTYAEYLEAIADAE